MKLKKLNANEVQYIIECVDEVFGYRSVFYNRQENILEFEKPIWFPEAPDAYLKGVGMVYDEGSGEIKMKFKMYNKEEDYTYYINGIEI